MCKTNYNGSKIGFCFKYNDRQYFFSEKNIVICVDNNIMFRQKDILVVRDIIFPKKKYAIFYIENVFFKKITSIKFKRRKRYKRIFGYKKKYIKLKLIKLY